MKAVDIFESLASSTWELIKLGQIHKVSQSEETITDLNLLEIARINCPEVQVVKTPKDKEKYQGTDWEWWIGNNHEGWLRYAVQAKKINPKTTRYDALAHKVDDILQIDILEQFARVNRAIPLYCFYNYLENIALEKYWRCNLFYEAKQLGCTITPSSNVRTALSKRGARKFNFLHSVAQTRPWRCLVRCPLMHQVYRTKSTNHTSLGFENVNVYQRLPSELSAALETGSLNQFSSEFYNQNLEMYPKRILVANIETDPYPGTFL